MLLKGVNEMLPRHLWKTFFHFLAVDPNVKCQWQETGRGCATNLGKWGIIVLSMN